MSKKTRKKSPKATAGKPARAKTASKPKNTSKDTPKKTSKKSASTSAKTASAKPAKATAKKSAKSASKKSGNAPAKASHKAPSKPLKPTSRSRIGCPRHSPHRRHQPRNRWSLTPTGRQGAGAQDQRCRAAPARPHRGGQGPGAQRGEQGARLPAAARRRRFGLAQRLQGQQAGAVFLPARRHAGLHHGGHRLQPAVERVCRTPDRRARRVGRPAEGPGNLPRQA